MESLSVKISRIAELADLNATPEFGGSFFRAKLAEMAVARRELEIATAVPAGFELPVIPKRFV